MNIAFGKPVECFSIWRWYLYSFPNVAHNNLSDELLDMKAQFGTFGKNSYEGNPFLCGPQLEKSCVKIDESPPLPQETLEASDEKWY